MLEASRSALLLAASGVTPERTAQRPGDGEWSVLEVLAHLIDCDYHYGAEAQAMRETPDHMLVHFDDGAWKAEHGNIRQTPLAEVLASLAASHEYVLGLLASMSDA